MYSENAWVKREVKFRYESGLKTRVLVGLMRLFLFAASANQRDEIEGESIEVQV